MQKRLLQVTGLLQALRLADRRFCVSVAKLRHVVLFWQKLMCLSKMVHYQEDHVSFLKYQTPLPVGPIFIEYCILFFWFIARFSSILLSSSHTDVPSFPHQQVSILLDPVLGKLGFCTQMCSLLIEVIPYLVSQNVPKLSFFIINWLTLYIFSLPYC